MVRDLREVLRSGTPKDQAIVLIEHARSLAKRPASPPGDLARQGRWDGAKAAAQQISGEDEILWSILMARLALRSGDLDRAFELIRAVVPPRGGSVLCYAHATAAAALLTDVLPPRPEEVFRIVSSLFWASQVYSDSHGGVRTRELQTPLLSLFRRICRAGRFDDAKALLKVGRPSNAHALLLILLQALIEAERVEEAREFVPKEPGWMRDSAVTRCVLALKRMKGDSAAKAFAAEVGGVPEGLPILAALQEGKPFVLHPEPRPPSDLARELDGLAFGRRSWFLPAEYSRDWAAQTAAIPVETLLGIAKEGCRHPAVSLSSLGAFLGDLAPDLSLQLAKQSFELAMATNSDPVIEDTLDNCLDVAEERRREDLAEAWIEQWLWWRASRQTGCESTELLSAVSECIGAKKQFGLLGRILDRCPNEESCGEVVESVARTITEPPDIDRLHEVLAACPFPSSSCAVAFLNLPDRLRDQGHRLVEAIESGLERRMTAPSAVILQALVSSGQPLKAIKLFESLEPAERGEANLAAAMESFVREGDLRQAAGLIDTALRAGGLAELHETCRHLAKALSERSDDEAESLTHGTAGKDFLLSLMVDELARRGQTERVLHWLPHTAGDKSYVLEELAVTAFKAGQVSAGDRFLEEAARATEEGSHSASLEESSIARRSGRSLQPVGP